MILDHSTVLISIKSSSFSFSYFSSITLAIFISISTISLLNFSFFSFYFFSFFSSFSYCFCYPDFTCLVLYFFPHSFEHLVIYTSSILQFIPRLQHISYMSGMVHTGGESPQDRLRVVWTCGMILASAYVLCHLSAVWSQLQMIGRSLRQK